MKNNELYEYIYSDEMFDICAQIFYSLFDSSYSSNYNLSYIHNVMVYASV